MAAKVHHCIPQHTRRYSSRQYIKTITEAHSVQPKFILKTRLTALPLSRRFTANRLARRTSSRMWRREVSQTFRGRDLLQSHIRWQAIRSFAPAADSRPMPVSLHKLSRGGQGHQHLIILFTGRRREKLDRRFEKGGQRSNFGHANEDITFNQQVLGEHCYKYHHNHHHYHKHQGLDPLIRSVSTVTAARANASSLFQLFVLPCGL